MLSLLAAALVSSTDHTGATAAADPVGRGAWFIDSTEDAVLLVTPGAGVERFSGCTWPSQLVVDSTGVAYVSCRGSGEVLRLVSGERPTAWPVGAEPAALALDEAAHRLYVGLVTSSTVIAVDSTTGKELNRVDVGAEPTAVGLFAAGVAVASRKSPTVQVFSRSLEGAPQPLRLKVPPVTDFPVVVGAEQLVPIEGRLVVIAPVAEVGSIDQPTYYSGSRGSPVTQDLFVLESVKEKPQLNRLMNLVLPDIAGAMYEPSTRTLTVASRGVGGLVTVNLMTHDVGLLQELPTGVVGVARDGERTFVFNDATREIAVQTPVKHRRPPRFGLRWAVSGVSFVHFDRIALGGAADSELARGRKLFHDGSDRHVSQTALSCASCHREGRDDGRTWLGQGSKRQTPMLAGRDIAHTGPYGWNGSYEHLEDYLKFTIGQRMRGYGLPEKDVVALARYVREGLRPVAKPELPAERVAEVRRGRVVFHGETAACSTCHGAGDAFTDGAAHEVGSLTPEEYRAWQDGVASGIIGSGSFGPIGVGSPDAQLLRNVLGNGVARPSSGLRAFGTSALVGRPVVGPVGTGGGGKGVGAFAGLVGRGTGAGSKGRGPVIGGLKLARNAPPAQPGMPAPLRRFDTPSLLQVALTAPYLHDGSAKTLDGVFTRLGDHMGKLSALTTRERGDLVAYLQTL